MKIEKSLSGGNSNRKQPQEVLFLLDERKIIN